MLTQIVSVDVTLNVLSTVDTFPKALVIVSDTVWDHFSEKVYDPMAPSF